MKSVFDPAVRQELASRIRVLNSGQRALWGKMNAAEMLKHCKLCDDMYLGNLKIKRVFIGRLIGKLMLKKFLKEEAAFSKNSPTSPVLKTTSDPIEFDAQKKEWLKQIEQYAHFSNPEFVHPFFGPMTREQIGYFAYKHADHHLRQFGV